MKGLYEPTHSCFSNEISGWQSFLLLILVAYLEAIVQVHQEQG